MQSLHRLYHRVPKTWRLRLAPVVRIPLVRSLASKAILRSGENDEIRRALRDASPIELVVHVGAHLAEEDWLYESLGATTVVWIEADPKLFKRMSQRLSSKENAAARHIAHQALVSEHPGDSVVLRRYSNDGASNSVYTPTDSFKQAWPGLKETGEAVVVSTSTLGDILQKHKITVSAFTRSLLVLDVQGHELSVLRGATGELVSQFSLICVEISSEEIYAGGADGREVLNWLNRAGFTPRTAIPVFHGDVLLAKGQVGDGQGH